MRTELVCSYSFLNLLCDVRFTLLAVFVDDVGFLSRVGER